MSEKAQEIQFVNYSCDPLCSDLKIATEAQFAELSKDPNFKPSFVKKANLRYTPQEGLSWGFVD